MKRLLFTLFIALGVLMTSTAQTNYYSTTREMTVGSEVYQCEVLSSVYVKLYNKKNLFVNMKQINTQLNRPLRLGELNEFVDVESESWTKGKSASIVKSAFSSEQKKMLGKSGLILMMYIDSQTGKVVGVEFTFALSGPFVSIPVSVYRDIEAALMKDIYFTPTDAGKQMNYLVRFWRQEIN